MNTNVVSGHSPAFARCPPTTSGAAGVAGPRSRAPPPSPSDTTGEAIRTEEAGMNASRVSAFPAVRAALIDLQRGFRKLPGLVADGRDMGTMIFPQAPLKVFLTASAACRAERRYKQLISKGISATLPSLRADLEARDARDMSRSVAPLKPAQDAKLLDNSDLTVETSVELVLDWWQSKQPFSSR